MNNDRFKFRIWDELQECYIENLFLGMDGRFYGMCGAFSGLPIVDWQATQDLVMEQCTGLKDKNGTLGYHNDRYVNEFGVECVIEWDKDKWVGKNETGIIYNIASWFDKCEIIGSIQ